MSSTKEIQEKKLNARLQMIYFYKLTILILYTY